MLTYTIVLTQEPDETAITVTVPAIPGVATWGATPEEALASAREAIELQLESYLERGRPFPRDMRSPGKRSLTIEVTPPTGASRHSA